MRTIISKTLLAALALLVSGGIGAADEVRLISVGGVKTALDPIIADFTKATGHTVKYTVGSPLVVRARSAARTPASSAAPSRRLGLPLLRQSVTPSCRSGDRILLARNT